MKLLALSLALTFAAYGQFGDARSIQHNPVKAGLVCTDGQVITWVAAHSQFECGAGSTGGIVVTGTPSPGQEIVATSSTTATWQTTQAANGHCTMAATTSCTITGLTGVVNKAVVSCYDNSGTLVEIIPNDFAGSTADTLVLNFSAPQTGYCNASTGVGATGATGAAGPAGVIASINADVTPAQVIAAGTGISVATVAGTTTITNTGSTAAFSALTSSTNSTAAMVVGTGASLGVSGSGTITATSLPTTGLTGALQAAQEPAHTGDMTNSAGSLATLVKQIHDNLTSVNNAASPYTIVAADSVLLCDATAGAVVLNLPAATATGREITLKKTDSTANACTFTRGGADTIDGVNTVALTVQYAAAKLADAASAVWYRTHVNQLAGDVTGISTATTVAKVNGNTPGGTCTNQAVTALSSSAVPTCTTLTSAYVSGTTGTGNFVLATSPTLTTPTIGVATATSINKMAITAPATSSTLAVADGKTLTASNTLTFAGTDSTTMTFPTTSATIARTDAANTFTGVQTMTSPALTTPTITTSATMSNNGIAGTSTDGLIMQNTTAATVGVQQWSPRLHFIGQGWKTTATAASQQTEWIAEIQQTQSTTNPKNALVFSANTNSSGLGSRFTIVDDGSLGSAASFAGLYITSGNKNLYIPTYVIAGVNLPLTATTGTPSTDGGTLMQNTGVRTRSSGSYGITNGTDPAGTIDISLARNAAGVFEIDNGVAGTFRDLQLRNLLASATVTNYNSVATAGMGVPPVYASVATTAQTASIGTTNLQCGGAVCPAGLYRVAVYTDVTSTGTGTLSSTIGWSDPAAARTITSTGIATTATNFERVDYTIRADGIANITYATTLSVSGTYSIYVTLERLQ